MKTVISFNVYGLDANFDVIQFCYDHIITFTCATRWTDENNADSIFYELDITCLNQQKRILLKNFIQHLDIDCVVYS